jgi:hypothetical protein
MYFRTCGRGRAIEMGLENNSRLHDMEVVDPRPVDTCQHLGEKIGLFLVVAFEADPVAGADDRLDQPPRALRRHHLAAGETGTSSQADVSLPARLPPFQAHLDLFERGIARKLDFSYSGPQGAAIARALVAGKIELGAIHSYIELFARYFMDLTPHVALIAASQADRNGNLYTGPQHRGHAHHRRGHRLQVGIVVAQVNEVVDTVSRVDIPSDRVDFIVKSERPFYVEPLFTRDPASVTEIQILMAMMAIKGIYANTVCGASTTASACRPRPSSSCCRPLASGSASRGRSPPTGR